VTALVTGLAAHLPPALWLPPGIEHRPCADVDTLGASLRAATGPVILWSEGLDTTATRALADVVRGLSVQVIEVAPEGCDGFTPSPLSAACRGVISGFGPAGIRRALETL
jgi:3-dehydroquinate dehydratase